MTPVDEPPDGTQTKPAWPIAPLTPTSSLHPPTWSWSWSCQARPVIHDQPPPHGQVSPRPSYPGRGILSHHHPSGDILGSTNELTVKKSSRSNHYNNCIRSLSSFFFFPGVDLSAPAHPSNLIDASTVDDDMAGLVSRAARVTRWPHSPTDSRLAWPTLNLWRQLWVIGSWRLTENHYHSSPCSAYTWPGNPIDSTRHQQKSSTPTIFIHRSIHERQTYLSSKSQNINHSYQVCSPTPGLEDSKRIFRWETTSRNG